MLQYFIHVSLKQQEINSTEQIKIQYNDNKQQMHNNLKSHKFLKLQYNHIHNMGCKRASENQLKIKNVPNYKIKKHLRFYFVHLILFATNKMSKCYWLLISKQLYYYRRCLIYLSNMFFIYSSLHIIIDTVLMLTIKTFFLLYLKKFTAFNFTLILLWT